MTTTGYQVWSSVLGTSLTSVNTSGEKVETKVFAGGTHIATQHEMNPATTSDDSLIFVTADPVTGSVARYSGSGASADIEESEPLGQMIETFDPGSGYPTSYEDVRGIARDPEWQCMLPKEFTGVFNEMPVHCKKAKLAERDFYLPGALAESDPKRVTIPADAHGSPRRGTPPTLKTGQRLAPEHLAQMRALAATGKFDNEEDGPDCGLTDCVVNIEAQSDPFASIDASVSGWTDGFDKAERKAIDRALDQAEKMASKTVCDEAFKKYGINSLKALIQMYRINGSWKTEILDGRNQPVAVQVGIDKKTGQPKYEQSTDSPIIPAFVLNGKTHLNSKFFRFSSFQVIAQALTIIHEAVHQYGKKRDSDFQPSGEANQKVGSKGINAIIVEKCYPIAPQIIKELGNL